MESKLQTKLIKFLKSKGCYVLKPKPGPGVPVGCPDVIFFYEGFWGAIEVKSSATAEWQPLQKETLEKFNKWSYARKIYPENYEEIIAEIEHIL